MTAEAEVLDLNDRLRDAWNRHDAAAFVEPWDDDADHVNIFGDIMDGKAAITAGTQAIFATMMARSHSEVVVRSLRFPTPDVAILDLDQTLTDIATPPGANIPFIIDGRMRSRIKLIARRNAERWTVASFQNTAVMRRPGTGSS
jgi:uncharacterized protein (TIGR02246 family)